MYRLLKIGIPYDSIDQMDEKTINIMLAIDDAFMQAQADANS